MQFCLTQSIRKHEGDIFNRYSPSRPPTAENYPVQQARKFLVIDILYLTSQVILSNKNSKLSSVHGLTWEVLFTNDPDEIANKNILSYFSNKVTMNGL